MATLMFDILPVMETSLTEAAKAFRRAERVVEQRRDELAAEIVRADQDGMRQVDIVRITGYTREHIRRIVGKKSEHD